MDRESWTITKEVYDYLIGVYRLNSKGNNTPFLVRRTRLQDFYYFIGTHEEYLDMKMRSEGLYW